MFGVGKGAPLRAGPAMDIRIPEGCFLTDEAGMGI